MKWRIKGTGPGASFSQAADIILSKRIKLCIKSVRVYFSDESAENLHQVRIAVRRLRYSLEVFFSCFDEKIFTSFYDRIEYLQDLSGEVRDLDVLKANILSLSEGKIKVPQLLMKKLEQKRMDLNEKLRLELMKFIHGIEIKEFKNQLNNRRVK